jgi:hypothetical protein
MFQKRSRIGNDMSIEGEVPWSQPSQNSNPVQVQGYSAAPFTQTNATLALILAAVSYFMCGICTAIPAVIMANGALAITMSQPGHPDQGLAKAAQILGWVMIVLTSLGILMWIFIIVFAGGIGLATS